MNQIVNQREKLLELKDRLGLLIKDRKLFLLSSYWIKIGLPNDSLSEYMKTCDGMGYNDKDKENDSLYQLAKEITFVTVEEKEVFDNFHNTLREIKETIEIIKQENGQAEDQTKVGITN